MKKILAVLVFLVMSSSGFANGIEGTWSAKIAGPDGDSELVFVLKMVDGKLTGVVQTMGGEMPITNTKVEGNEFSFDVPFDGMVIQHKCTLKEDDTIDMKATGTPMGDMQLVLSRKA